MSCRSRCADRAPLPTAERRFRGVSPLTDAQNRRAPASFAASCGGAVLLLVILLALQAGLVGVHSIWGVQHYHADASLRSGDDGTANPSDHDESKPHVHRHVHGRLQRHAHAPGTAMVVVEAEPSTPTTMIEVRERSRDQPAPRGDRIVSAIVHWPEHGLARPAPTADERVPLQLFAYRLDRPPRQSA